MALSLRSRYCLHFENGSVLAGWEAASKDSRSNEGGRSLGDKEDGAEGQGPNSLPKLTRYYAQPVAPTKHGFGLNMEGTSTWILNIAIARPNPRLLLPRRLKLAKKCPKPEQSWLPRCRSSTKLRKNSSPNEILMPHMKIVATKSFGKPPSCSGSHLSGPRFTGRSLVSAAVPVPFSQPRMNTAVTKPVTFTTKFSKC